MPGAVGFLGWTGDPANIFQTALDSTGSIHGGGIWLPAGATVSRIAELVSAAGVAMTHGIFGLFDSAFNLLAQSADTPAAFQAAGWVELPLLAPYTTPAAGIYYLADLLAAGTTMPSTGNMGSLGTTNARSLLPDGIWRYFTMAGPLAAFPSPLTPAISGVTRCLLCR